MRPRTLRKITNLTSDAVDLFVKDVESLAVSFSEIPVAIVLERDPKDEPYVNLAIASSAVYLASWDNDLLDLMGVEEFRQRFPSLTILEPPALLRALGIRRRRRRDHASDPAQPPTQLTDSRQISSSGDE